MALRFEWDLSKGALNSKKHGVSFDEATSAFADTLSITIPDPEHSIGEERFILLGRSLRDRLLVVVHLEVGDTIRLISARLASRSERKTYEEG